MKRTLKIILGVVGVLALGLAVLVTWNWESVEILTGTGNLAGPPQGIPEAIEPAAPLRDQGDADWPCWRGTAGDARSTVTGIKTDWTTGLTQLWEVNYLCQGKDSAAWTAPVIQGDRLVVCGRDEGHDLAFCLNVTNGQLLWHGHYAAAAGGSHGMGMRGTPAIDEGRVYTFGRSGDLVCWDLKNGIILWHRNVHDEGGQAPKWGHASSPAVAGDAVLVQGGGTVRVIAYHKETGNVIWASGQGNAGYAPLVPVTLGDTPACLAFHGHGLAALALDTGRELWNTPWETAHGVNATTPLVEGEHVFITSGYGTGAQWLEVSDTAASAQWTNRVMASHHSDGVILDGFLYGYSGQSIQNRGVFKCVDLATGTQKWSTKDMGWGTCVYLDGHLLCLDIKGNLFLMKPDPAEFIQVTTLPRALGDVKGPVWTLPVIANDKLYLRFKQRLVCYSLL
ncbi:MAG: PQQ-binding-like beta-propeller repeat protein [Planctomycetes bacterium]|nr:PQQ-binding-like beta-propeller repeat protein [Planctomycetota bacterium]